MQRSVLAQRRLGDHDRAGRGWSLFWRVFAVNAAVLVSDGLILALAPPVLRSRPGAADAIVVLVGLGLMLALTYVLMQQAFGPLRRLRQRVAEIDEASLGHRLPDDSATREVSDLAQAFNGMLRRLEAERRRSALRTLAAQEDERRRLSRELHDEVGQTLSAALLLLVPWSSDLPRDVVAHLGEAAEVVRDGLESARRVARELRPEALDQLGLVTALEQLMRRIAFTGRLEVRRHLPAQLPRLASEAELVVYRVAQEALTNVLRHARASQVELALGADEDVVRLVVRDDGCGIHGADTGQGVRGMRERAFAVDGRLAVTPGPSGGTEVRLEVPVA